MTALANMEADVPRFLSEEACRAVVAQVQSYGISSGTPLNLQGSWRAGVRWARNRITAATDWRNNTITGAISTNQLDAESLQAAVNFALQSSTVFPTGAGAPPQGVATVGPYPKTSIWSETTYTQAPEVRNAVAGQLADMAERAGLMSAGYLSVEARGVAVYVADGTFLYAPQTLAECSLTVRDPQGTGSGWAGASSYDWGRFDPQHLAEVAVQKCLASRNPVRIEPGRYTLIMEPQAVFELMRVVIGFPYTWRMLNETFKASADQYFPFADIAATIRNQQSKSKDPAMARGVTRIGQRVFDPRLTIDFDPLDPELGVLPFTSNLVVLESRLGDPYVPVTWVDHGILTTMQYDRDYAVTALHNPVAKPNSGAFRLHGNGPLSTIEEMIATTKRGLVVTRFSQINAVDIPSMLLTGVTRDGLWLVENGKITKAVKNLRFTDSPMFVFNKVDQIGTAVPVYSPGRPAIVPPMKVRDFSFTGLIDAV